MGGIVPGHSKREIDQAKGILVDARDEVLSGIERLVQLVESGQVDHAHDALIACVLEAEERRAAA